MERLDPRVVDLWRVQAGVRLVTFWLPVSGALGALLTGVFAAPSLGGTGVYDYVANKVKADYSILEQVWVQLQGVLTTVVWSGLVAFIAFKVVDLLLGLRVSEEEEREGLDISSHGETAYSR